MDAELLLQHQRYLRRLVRSLAKGGPEADDLEQSTWLAALEQRPRSEPALRAWLARVARNLFLNARRAGEREARGGERALDEHAWPPADEVAAELERAERVLAAVRALPEPLRAAVHARYYEGLALADVARLSGVSSATIKDRLERARTILGQRLARERREELLGALLAVFRRGRSLGGALLVKKLVVVVAVALVIVLAWRARAPRPEAEPVLAGAPEVANDPDVPAVARPSAAERAPVAPELAAVGAPAEASRPSRAGSLLVSVRWPDGTPAERVLVRAVPDSEGELARFPRTAMTDAEGLARFGGLDAGQYRLRLEREKDTTTSTVFAGTETQVALSVSPGSRVEGLVVDQRGSPVAGAGVWISTRYASMSGPPLDHSFAALTGPDGRFVIPSAGKAWLIGACAEGYAPSKEKSLTYFSLPKVEVRLVLPGPGGTIEGRVVDSGGTPLEGAAIVADVGYRFERYEGGGIHILNSLRVRTASARDGSFRFLGVQPSSIELCVLAPGHASWSKTIAVSAGATAHVEARVGPAGSVHGRARTPDGTPLEDLLVVASIQALSQPLDLTGDWLEQDWNQIVASSWDGFAATHTGADGAFRLDGLPAGHSFLVGQTAGGDRSVVPLWIEAGKPVEQDLVLERGLELVCRLVDERGKALGDWSVYVARVADESHGTTMGSRGRFRTDEDGRLVVPSCADALYRLDIRDRGREERGIPCPDALALRPGAREHRIVVVAVGAQGADDARSAFVRGSLLDDAGRPVARARVDLKFADGGSDRIALTAPDGTFLSKGFEPGVHGLILRAPGFPYLALAPRPFEAGETVDVGTQSLHAPGFLKARIARGDGGAVDEERVIADLYWPDGSYCWVRSEIELGEALFDPLEAGSYTLTVRSSCCENVSTTVAIEAGATTEVEVHLPSAKGER